MRVTHLYTLFRVEESCTERDYDVNKEEQIDNRINQGDRVSIECRRCTALVKNLDWNRQRVVHGQQNDEIVPVFDERTTILEKQLIPNGLSTLLLRHAGTVALVASLSAVIVIIVFFFVNILIYVFIIDLLLFNVVLFARLQFIINRGIYIALLLADSFPRRRVLFGYGQIYEVRLCRLILCFNIALLTFLCVELAAPIALSLILSFAFSWHLYCLTVAENFKIINATPHLSILY